MTRHGFRLALSLTSLVLGAGCGAQSRNEQQDECISENAGRYVESFETGDVESLGGGCWLTDNEGPNTSTSNKIFVEDGDLLMRVSPGLDGTDLDDWTDTDQAPMYYRRVRGDFLLVARVEASSISSADHCVPEGSRAGLVLRESKAPSHWAIETVEPYLFTNTGAAASCAEDADDSNDPTVAVRVESAPKDPALETLGVGVDGEADLAICRAGTEVHYFYGKATADATKNEWLSVGNASVSQQFAAEGLDVGVTVAGRAPNFAVAGHFNWVVLESGSHGDGCSGALEQFEVPEDM